MKSVHRPLGPASSNAYLHFSPARAFRLAALALAMCAGQAFGQTTDALQDTTCIGSRGTKLICTAGEFSTVIVFKAAPNTPLVCQAGSTIEFSGTVGLTNSNTDRYDIGFFIGQQNNDPREITAGNICSAAVVPTSLLSSLPAGTPWRDFDGDTCADLIETTTPANYVLWNIQKMKVLCNGDLVTGQLTIPYVVTYDQIGTNNASCSASNVLNGSPSKCNTGVGGVTLNDRPVLVAGYVELTKQTSPDSNAQSFSFTATGPAGINLYTSTDGGNTLIPVEGNTTTVNLIDNNSVRIYMPVAPFDRTLSISETLVNNWQSTASIVCNPVTGGGTPVVAVDNQARTITANLNTVNTASTCTVTNTLRPRITLSKSVASRQENAPDQFTVSATSAGLLYQDNSQTTTATVSATTAGTGTVASTVFRSTPGQSVTLTDAMAAGSTYTLSRYNSSLTCTNAYTGPGATPGSSLPSGLAVTTYNFTPAPGDDITCTYTNTAKPTTIAVAKISNGGIGTFSFTSANGLTFPNITTTTAGVAVTGAAQTLLSTQLARPLAIAETAPSGGFVLTDISCTSSVQTTNLPNRTVVLNVPISEAGTDIVCTFTNALPSSDFSITKTNGVSSLISGVSTIYTIRVTSNGPDTVTAAILSDPAVTGLNKTAVACSAAVGNKCVTPPNVAQLEGGAFALPTLAAGEFYEITVTATVSATGY